MRKIPVGLICKDSIAPEIAICIASITDFELIGYGGTSNKELFTEYSWPYFEDLDNLIDRTEAILLIVPAESQFELAKRALKKSKHIFIEEPLTTNIEKAEILLSMQREADVKVQVGSGMRLNPSVIETNVFKLKPLYIETQYLTEKESELSVVLDLMLRDIDFVLHLIKSEVRKISANSVSLSGVTSDVVNARIEFGNGGVASLTVNRNAKKEIHTASIFENGNAVVLDFNASIMENVPQSAYNLAITKQAEENSNKSTLIGHRAEALKVELQSFFNCIIENKNPLVPLSDACRALKLAYQILDKIEERRMEN